MDYEVYLRYTDPSAAQIERLPEVLRADLEPEEAGDGLTFRLVHGTEVSRVRLVPADAGWWDRPEPGTRPVGLDLAIPAGATEAHREAACKWLFAVAPPGPGTEIYDPQLGRAVTQADLDAIGRGATALGAYLLETHGAPAGHAHFDPEPGAIRSSPGARLLLWGLGLLLLLWVVVSRLAC